MLFYFAIKITNRNSLVQTKRKWKKWIVKKNYLFFIYIESFWNSAQIFQKVPAALNATVPIEPSDKDIFFLIYEIKNRLCIVPRSCGVNDKIELILHFLKKNLQMGSQDYLSHPCCFRIAILDYYLKVRLHIETGLSVSENLFLILNSWKKGLIHV